MKSIRPAFLLRQTLIGKVRARTEPGAERNIRRSLLAIDFMNRRLQAEADTRGDREIAR